MEAKKKPITAIAIVKETFVVGKLVVPGQVLHVPAHITEADARVLIAQGQAIEGDGSGVAATFVERAVVKHQAAVNTRVELRDKLKPVSNREIFEKLLETQNMLVSLLGKMGDLMFVEPEQAPVAPPGGDQATTEAGGSKPGKPGK